MRQTKLNILIETQHLDWVQDKIKINWSFLPSQEIIWLDLDCRLCFCRRVKPTGKCGYLIPLSFFPRISSAGRFSVSMLENSRGTTGDDIAGGEKHIHYYQLNYIAFNILQFSSKHSRKNILKRGFLVSPSGSMPISEDWEEYCVKIKEILKFMKTISSPELLNMFYFSWEKHPTKCLVV